MELATDLTNKRMLNLLKPRSLGARILAINFIGLLLLALGFIYVDKSEDNLIKARIEALLVQANLFAFSFDLDPGIRENFRENLNKFILKRQDVDKFITTRTRIFDKNQTIIFDTSDFDNRRQNNKNKAYFDKVFEAIENYFGRNAQVLPSEGFSSFDIDQALNGNTVAKEYKLSNGGIIVHVTVPVYNNNEIVNALLLTTEEGDIGLILQEGRQGFIRVFIITIFVTLFLSASLSTTIARPLTRLSKAAERVTDAGIGDTPIMDNRRDEIGTLSRSIRRMTVALQDRVSAVEAFTADVAHEVKNPLTSLQSAIETLNTSENEDEKKALILIAFKDLKRLDRLISDISSSSRLEVELAKGEFIKIDVRDILKSVIEVTESTIIKKYDVNIEREITKENIIINGIGDKIAQVFHNLIDNALSFSEKGDTINIHLWKAKNAAIIEIKDNGPGIPKESLIKVFDRFYTYRPNDKSFGNNSGLGLSICKQIINTHGGSIIAGNRENGGAIFTVTLPLVNK
mgnify:FL=1